MANKRKQVALLFPLGGLARRWAYQQQQPYTTPDCMNVRAVASIEGRERGGSRPGLAESHSTDLGSEIRLLAPMTLAMGDSFTAWSDNFSGASMAAAWTRASWASDLPGILPSALASVDTSVDEGEAVLSTLPIDSSETYTAEVYLVPWNGAWHGKYRLYLRLDNTTPAIGTAGVKIELTQTGSTGAYTATLTSYLAGTPTIVDTAGATVDVKPSWLSVAVSGNTIAVYWQGTEIMSGTAGAQTGLRVGFGMECSVAGGLCLANTFRVQYYSTGSVDVLRSMLIASSGGDLYREVTYGSLVDCGLTRTIRDDTMLCAAQSGQKLYIADYGDVAASGTDGTVSGTSLDAAGIADWTTLGIVPVDMVAVISNPQGTAVAGTYLITSVAAGSVTLASAAGTGACAYRIERSPKVYDPLTNGMIALKATAGKGQVPTGCPLICRYLDRIVLAGAEIAPHVWYMSRQSDPNDWDYSQEDSQRAVAGTSSEAGVPGSPITALIPHSDDYLIMGCRDSVWRLRGDPAYGGSLDSLSHTIGIIGPKAWCLGPGGELIFLSLDGLYALAAGGDSYPVPLSRELLPQEFLNLNPDMLTVSLEYDIQGRGIHVYLTPDSSNQRIHWWMDWERKTFWPVSLESDYEPTYTCAYQATAIEDSGVILGCRDGMLRRYSSLAETDCGTVFESYAMIGPIALAPEGTSGRIMSMDATLANNSGDVTWETACGNSAEAAVLATASDSGTWSAGLNATARPAVFGQAATVTVTGDSGRSWALESIVAIRRESGPRRLA